MPQKIMDVLMLGRCSHEFSWPRRGTDGDYYQVCLLCAAEYKYDWATMRRTERVEHAKPDSVVRRGQTREKRPSWTPRARRLKLDVALRYRVNNTSVWHEATPHGTGLKTSTEWKFHYGWQPLVARLLRRAAECQPNGSRGEHFRKTGYASLETWRSC
jgi:hypothetical protein